jgi:hypothetical protein
VYICANCNTKTEQRRPWLYERNKKPIPQEETTVEQEPVDSEELSTTEEADSLASRSGESPRDDFVLFAEADSSNSETTTSPDDLSDSDVEHHWSHDLVLCASPEAVSLPLSLEGRVIGLEEKLHDLQEQTKTLQGGMTKLEAQLERLEQLLQTAYVGQ